MSKSLYTVKRENICVGKVITDFEILPNSKDSKIILGELYPCRSILYVPNHECCAEDLLYGTDPYPIMNPENIEQCKNSEFIVMDSINLSYFLKFFGYGEELDFYDIESIRKRFFNGKFPLEHPELFGLLKTYEEERTLPIEYYYMLRSYGNFSLKEYLKGYAENLNAFKPNKKEGPIRSLKKYNQ